jgi:1-phosphatidylinositol-3-phosphate 5-kinase
MTHLKIMLRQMLLKEKIPNIREWEETLLKLALRIAKELAFTPIPYHQGEDMDVRRYVKIKKIPGGRPCDSEHVNGAVITKNVAHKQMSRSQNNPRIMLVTFPLEFHRVEGQYMQFGQILRQEKEYLGNLASRIAALRPHVVLVEKTVSRLALDALVKHNIVVARNVKPSAIATIARMTQGDEFSSIDKLAIEPRLGHCARFRLQTFDHPLIPERRKTYMRFEGCNSDLGCTIILRGGDIETLRRVKRVTRFLTFIVRNLKLETHLWKDSVISLPCFNPDAIPLSLCKSLGLHTKVADFFQQRTFSSVASHLRNSAPALFGAPSASSSRDDDDDIDPDIPSEEAEQIRLSRRIDQSLEPYRTTFISVSATLRFTPPFPVLKMKELDDGLHTAKRAWEDDVVLKEEKPPVVPTPEAKQAVPGPDLFSVEDPHRADIIAQIEALDVPVSLTPEHGSPQPVEDEGSYPEVFTTASVGCQPSSPGKTQSPVEEPPETLKTVTNIALESKYRLLKWKHEEHHRIWEWYLRKNPDDFEVEKYQQIFLWEYTVPTSEIGQHRACFIPRLIRMQFYGENDLTLGQFIEKAVTETLGNLLDPKAICEGKCYDQPLARHCKVYVHNETRLFVAVEQWDGQIVNRTFGPAPDLITTWSACRVCGSATPFIPVSPEMQRYSFAKFLELHFYPADVKLVQGAGCEHNIYQHHIRYFASRGMTVRFQTDSAVMHEIVFPPFRVHVRHETLLEIKNSDFEKLQRSNFNWYSNLIDELKFISIDAATGDEETDARLNVDVNCFIARAEAERADIRRLINKTYRESAPTDTLALNRVHAYRQDKIVALQQDFDRLPKPKPVTILDKATKRTSALRTMWPAKPNLGLLPDPSLSSVLPSETEEGPFIKKRLEPDLFASSASEVSDSEPDPPVLDSEQILGNSTSEVLASREPEELTVPTSLVPKDSLKFQKSDVESDSTVGTNGKGASIDGLPRVVTVSCSPL